MTATDELRRMLDERGVEWWPMHDAEVGYREDRDTEFLACGCKHVAHEWGCRLQVDMLTPEQAIEATLGRRTTTRTGKYRTKYGRSIPVCECCGYGIGDMRWHFCPSCGAEVVDG